MQTSQTIVSINKDANAPIFDFSDFGVIGDLHSDRAPADRVGEGAQGLLGPLAERGGPGRGRPCAVL